VILPVVQQPIRDVRSGRFRNRLPVRQPNIGGILLAYLRERAPRTPTAPLPLERRTAADYRDPPSSGLRVTWLGHSSSLVELEGRRFLIDPVWAERASPAQWFGPRRFFAPPLALDDLPSLDAVLLSHDHYDHLDEATVRTLGARGLRFVAPIGVGARLVRWGIPAAQVTEVSWWESVAFGAVQVTATPARHFSGRSPIFVDRDRSLWCGYALGGTTRRLYYAGDTAMSGDFPDIGAALGPFDATLMEIGAYSQLWPDVHIGPEQAIAAHVQARGGVFIPVHWGTFDLAMHGWTEPVERVLVAAARAGVRVLVPRPGGRVEPTEATAVERWWPSLPWRTAEKYPLVSTGFSSR
jgi:L-ascorbate metabolism protein UlaG (beta-lactamase superfamily)